jgi:hypothetical protein
VSGALSTPKVTAIDHGFLLRVGGARFPTTLFMTRVELRRCTPGRVARRLS